PLFAQLSFSLSIRLPPRSPLFPYTTLFRSAGAGSVDQQINVAATSRKGLAEFLIISSPPRARGFLWRAYSDHIGSETRKGNQAEDRKSTRLNSSHVSISYAVFCLKKKIKNT